MVLVALDDALHAFDTRLGQVRQSLYYCDALVLSPVRREVGHSIAAAAYVWTAAAVETATKSMVSGLVDGINAATVPMCDLRLSLFALIEGSRHDSLQDLRGLKMWDRRAELHESVQSTAICELDDSRLPLDGRTMRPQHFNTVWSVFGLPGSATLSPLHSLALRDLADSRNSVAHGEEDAKVIAGLKSRDDMLRLLELIEELILNLWDAGNAYLTQRGYER